MLLHSGDGPYGQQNKRSKNLGSLPEDKIISDSTQDLVNDIYKDIDCSNPPTLPQFPIRTALPPNRKRDRDEGVASSSDAPLFSSDDLPSSSADNYLTKRRKRQHQRPWFEEEDDLNIAHKCWCPPGPRTRGPFTRAFDSGVWMGSDEASENGDFEFDGVIDQDLEGVEEGRIAGKDEEVDELLDDIHLLVQPPEDHRRNLVSRAMQTTEDPGGFEGPIFPYWQRQPDNLEAFHTLQEKAQAKVLECVEKGQEDLDLSTMHLQQIRTPTLKPLSYYTKQVPQQGSSNRFQGLTPDLGLYLSNNFLGDVPSEVYHLVNLKVLSLRSNNLTEILPAISGLSHLNELNIGGNQLRWLPWEILDLVDSASPSHVEKCNIHPNPFLKPVPSVWNIEDCRETLRKGYKGHLASTRVAFLDTTGSSLREYAPAPSSVPEHWETSFDAKDSVYPPLDKRTKTPSLMELAIRACYKTTQLSQLPFLLPPDCPPHITQLLESTWKLRESGGKRCSVCGDDYIIPRTEWIEWWHYMPSNASLANRDSSIPAHKGLPVPMLRRGCSWQCFEENPNVVIRGWNSSVAPGGRDDELNIAVCRPIPPR